MPTCAIVWIVRRTRLLSTKQIYASVQIGSTGWRVPLALPLKMVILKKPNPITGNFSKLQEEEAHLAGRRSIQSTQLPATAIRLGSRLSNGAFLRKSSMFCSIQNWRLSTGKRIRLVLRLLDVLQSSLKQAEYADFCCSAGSSSPTVQPAPQPRTPAPKRAKTESQ